MKKTKKLQFNISDEDFLAAVFRYERKFDMWLYITPENAGTDEGRKECMDLIEKSCRDNHDYVAPRYGLDYEEQHRTYDYTLD